MQKDLFIFNKQQETKDPKSLFSRAFLISSKQILLEKKLSKKWSTSMDD